VVAHIPIDRYEVLEVSILRPGITNLRRIQYLAALYVQSWFMTVT
jgi:hypothetical protein